MKRVIVRVITVLVLAATLFGSPGGNPLIQIASAQSGSNLALGKPAVASSQQGTNAPAKATDGLLSTAWSSAFSEPSWIYVDLGAAMAFEQIVLIWETAYGRDYRIDGSNDTTTWTPLAQIVDGNGGTDYINIAGSWRYVRMYGTRRGTGWGFSLLEFQIFDIAQTVPVEYPVPPAPPPRATGSTLFSDDFNDMNIDDWQIISGNWSGGTGTLSTSVPCNTGPYVIVNGEESWTDFQLSLDFQRLNGWDYGGILLRYSESGFYRVEINPSIPYGGWVKISKFGGGEVASRPWPFINSKWDHLIIDVEGATIEIYALDANQNAELLLSYTDPAPIPSGKIGFTSSAGAAACPVMVQYDNVIVKSIIPSFRVLGNIVDSLGNPIPQVDLSLNTSDVTTFTDALGNYSLQRILYGAYTLYPSKPGYKFSPESRIVIGGLDMTDVNFTGTPTHWTLMYYLAGDDTKLNASYTQVFNQLEKAAGNPYVRVLVVWDTLGDNGTTYYEVKSDSDLSQFANYLEDKNKWSKGELNMGSPDTLTTFINWAMSNYPADHFALILDDHGDGLGGGMSDKTSQDDRLFLNEISAVLNNISSDYTTSSGKKIDVLVMNACLMGMLEDAYQFKNFIDYYVASENLQWSFNNGYYETVHNITSTTTPLELGELFVQKYEDEVSWNIFAAYTMSVADLSNIDTLVQAINQMATLINSDLAGSTDELTTVLAQVQRYKKDEYVDLYDFARLIKEEFENPDIQQSAQTVMDSVEAYITYERHANFRGVNNSHGVSIFFPTTRSSFYNNANYDFAVGAIWTPPLSYSIMSPEEETPPVLWGSFLVEYINLVNPDGTDQSTPPPVVSKPITYNIFVPLLLK